MENKVAVRNKAAQSAVASVGREKEREREREEERESARVTREEEEGWAEAEGLSLCTKRITFISSKPRVAPNCNQFFVFLSQPHSSLTLSSSFALPRGLSHFIRSPLSAPFLLVPF